MLTRIPLMNPVTLLLAIAIVGGSIIFAITTYSFAVVDSAFSRNSDTTAAALAAADVADGINQVYVLGSAAMLDGAIAGDPNTPIITTSRAIAAHDSIQRIVEDARKLDSLRESARSQDIVNLSIDVERKYSAFLVDPSAQRLGQLAQDLPALYDLVESEIASLQIDLEEDRAALQRTTAIVRWAAGFAIVTSVALMTVASVAVGRTLRRAVNNARSEESRLLETTAILQRRDAQFRALYQVISEVTESLNMSYVVATTIRETKRLVGADVVGIHRLNGAVLESAGVSGESEEQVAGLQPLKLGEGLVGRAAKRGRTVRIDEDAEAHMCAGERIEGIESGLIIPLVVGARIVGTLSCWARARRSFSKDDQQVLEMMASQVATSVAAAGLHQETQQQAGHDALTLLPNRRQLSQDIAGPLTAAIARAEPMAMAMADIDHFKRFNDDFGHLAGDVTLQKVAEVLRSAVREGDIVYRYGGEEFLIFFAGASASEAFDLGERLRAAVERTPLTGEGLEPVGPVTISLGIAAFPDHAADLVQLIDIADRAMYASKKNGRNRVTMAGEAQLMPRAAA